ncbi:hypothetical protein [Calidithermus chliarophilus]|uniref:hypothetical protein n=1 Tax=Calidithermus chliarophilus TaxID=52023 RepID=UPI000415EA30|nr:hypothetical protein [Calidithermus chliarophilus]
MAEYSAALNPTFTLEQVADLYKTAFDARGWGTGLVSIQGGYRFTAQMEADTAANPVRLTPDGAIRAPNSISAFKGSNWADNGDGTFTAQGMVEWVDNFHGKNLCHPLLDHNRRWRLLFWVPGLKRFRLRFTVVKRPDNGASGPFSDLKLDVREAVYTGNTANVSNNNRSASLKDAGWGANYAVGQQYTTLWSHGAGGAIAGVAEAWTYCSIGAVNAHVRIDAIEYEVTPNRFGVQSPSQDSGLCEFAFAQASGAAHGAMFPLPVKNPYKPRVLLCPPEVHDDANAASDAGSTQARRHFYALWNAFRDEQLSAASANAGVLALAAVCAVVKNYSFGSTLNVYLASNSDFKGFFLRSSQSGRSDYQIVTSQAERTSYLPASAVTVPESVVRFSRVVQDALYDNSGAHAVPRTGYLFQVRGSAPRTLDRVRFGELWFPSGTYVAKLYAVAVQDSASGKKLTYQSTVAAISLTTASGVAEAGGLNLALAPGYYLLTLPPNLPTRAARGPHSYLTPGREVRHLGQVVCRDPATDGTWTPGATQLNVTADDLTPWGGNLLCQDNAALSLDFLGCDTPSQAAGAYAEGFALLTGSALDGGYRAEDFEPLPTAPAGNDYTGRVGLGVVFPFGLELTVNQLETPYTRWQLSPLPGYFGSFRRYWGDAWPQPGALEFEFGPGSGPAPQTFDAYADRPYRQSSPRLLNIRLRTGTALAAGQKYANGDGSFDAVVATHNYGNHRSTAFHSR